MIVKVMCVPYDQMRQFIFIQLKLRSPKVSLNGNFFSD